MVKVLERRIQSRHRQQDSESCLLVLTLRRLTTSFSYGREGFQIIMLVLMNLYGEGSPELSQASYHPLPYDTFIREVLVPEVTAHLIEEDLDVSYEAAVAVLYDSQRYGELRYPADDSAAFEELQELYSRIHRRVRTEAGVQDDHRPTLSDYLASNTVQDYKTWAQMEESELNVKEGERRID